MSEIVLFYSHTIFSFRIWTQIIWLLSLFCMHCPFLSKSNSTFALIPIPSCLFKDIILAKSLSLPYINNFSFLFDNTQWVFKSDTTALIVKAPSLDPTVFSSYCHVSLLLIIAKLTEKFTYGHQLTSFPPILSWIHFNQAFVLTYVLKLPVNSMLLNSNDQLSVTILHELSEAFFTMDYSLEIFSSVYFWDTTFLAIMTFCWLSAEEHAQVLEDHPQFLAVWASPTWLLTSSGP